MRRRLIIAAAVVLGLTAVITVTWKVLGSPPPRLLLEYGPPPAGGPTGRSKTVGGIEFVELS